MPVRPRTLVGQRGYAEFLEAIRAPAHRDRAEMLDWCDGEFDSAAPHRDRVNAFLRQSKP
jgi:hypothetical protein